MWVCTVGLGLSVLIGMVYTVNTVMELSITVVVILCVLCFQRQSFLNFILLYSGCCSGGRKNARNSSSLMQLSENSKECHFLQGAGHQNFSFFFFFFFFFFFSFSEKPFKLKNIIL